MLNNFDPLRSWRISSLKYILHVIFIEVSVSTRNIVVHAYLPSFLRYDIFHFPSSKSFQTGCCCLASFSLSIVRSPKQATTVFTPALLFPPMFYPLLSGPIFLDPIPPLLLYIKHLFPFNKQFSSDSFLDWEGLQLGF